LSTFYTAFALIFCSQISRAFVSTLKIFTPVM